MSSIWQHVPEGPPDAILGVTDAFKADASSVKMNLGVGAYRTEEGKPYVLGAVQKAEELVLQTYKEKEYLPITGLAEFVQPAMALAYGAESIPWTEKRIAATQSISGTGALRIGGAFLQRFYNASKQIYMPTPTWGNHGAIFKDAGLDVKSYRYYKKETKGLDFEGMMQDIKAMPERSILLLHACAHNPTGVDPTKEQWREISRIAKERHHFVFFDMAYQGFASGDCDRDAYALRHFVSEGHPIALSQSFAKNMGLYGERVGTFSLVCNSAAEKNIVMSQMKILVRALYSNPPLHGAALAATVLNNPELKAQWFTEVKGMADRIISMRQALKDKLQDLGSAHNWDHITNQIGMFCYTGLNAQQVERMWREHHTYFTKDGRISISGINSKNVNHLAKAIHETTK